MEPERVGSIASRFRTTLSATNDITSLICFYYDTAERADMIEPGAETTVDASPETTFEYIAVPKNHPKILPSLVEISNGEGTDVGKRGRYVFEMVGQAMGG